MDASARPVNGGGAKNQAGPVSGSEPPFFANAPPPAFVVGLRARFRSDLGRLAVNTCGGDINDPARRKQFDFLPNRGVLHFGKRWNGVAQQAARGRIGAPRQQVQADRLEMAKPLRTPDYSEDLASAQRSSKQ